MNKNIKKAGAGLLLSALVISGASAWLSTSKTGTSENMIKPGTFSVKFTNQKDTITLQDTFPMTAEYAKQHLTPYTYTVRNTGDIPMDYEVVLTDVNVSGDRFFIKLLNEEDKVNLIYSNSTYPQSVFYGEVTDEYLGGPDRCGLPLHVGHLEPGQEATHTLYAFVDEYYEESDGPIDGKAASFKLKVNAVQDIDGEAPYEIVRHASTEFKGPIPESVKTLKNEFNISSPYYVQEHKNYYMHDFYCGYAGGNPSIGDTKISEENYQTIISKFKNAGFTNVQHESATLNEQNEIFVATNKDNQALKFVKYNSSYIVYVFQAKR